LAEQRIPNPRVGSSNLSTPAIFKALAEMLEPFCFLNLIYAISKAADSPTYQNSACWESKPPPSHINASAEVLFFTLHLFDF
ncbi:hypothetical protein, partial [Vibrio splendidus]|uniref:hypothetical protein n=3 Tax=Vibrio splendidus TaxID=29497 RepID=UPI002732F92C